RDTPASASLSALSSLSYFLIAVKRHHDHSNCIKKEFNWGGLLTVSKFQFIIIMGGSMAVCRQTWCWLHLDQKATGSGLSVTVSEA
ncbi:hypothetical protein ACQP3F_26140, partial [Escherichia coli]